MSACVYRLARLSYCRSGVMPASACCPWPAITWSRIGSPCSGSSRRSVSSVMSRRRNGRRSMSGRRHRSTLWRFLQFLGTQSVALQLGLQLCSEHDPLFTDHRFLGAVAPHKYRSPHRGEILRTARRLLHLIDHWNRMFAESFFPRFATRSRPP